MINNATAQARNMAKADELQAQVRTKSIESGLPVSYLEAATGMIPADLPDEVRARAEAVRTSAVATAERRMMEDSLEIARQAKADRDAREMIRALAPAESGAFRGAAPFEPFGAIAPFVPHAVSAGRVPSARPAGGVGSMLASVYGTPGDGTPDEASLWHSGGPGTPADITGIIRRRVFGPHPMPGRVYDYASGAAGRGRQAVTDLLSAAAARLTPVDPELPGFMMLGDSERPHTDALAMDALGVDGNRGLGAAPSGAPLETSVVPYGPPPGFQPTARHDMLLFGPRAQITSHHEGTRDAVGFGTGMLGGAMYGSPAGPVGAIAGGMLGGVAGFAMSRHDHKKAKYEAEIDHIMRSAGVSRDMAEYVHKVQTYADEHGMEWRDAAHALGGTYADDSREIKDLTREEQLWIQQYTRTADEIGHHAAARSADSVLEMHKTHPASSSGAPRASDWRNAPMMKEPAQVFAYELYKHPEMRGFVDRVVGSGIPTMENIQEIYESLGDEPMFREDLAAAQAKIVERFGERFVLMDDVPPQPAAIVPRMIRSGTSGGGRTFRPRVSGTGA